MLRAAEIFLQQASFLLINKPAWLAGAALRCIKRRPLDEHEPDRSEIHSILVVRLDGIGDIVIFSSFLRGLRKGFPGAWITLVVDERLVSFVELCPFADQVIGFNVRGTRYKRLLLGGFRAWRLAAARLHARRFDLAINARWDVDSRTATLLGYFSLARRHLGFSESVNPRKAGINRGADRLFSHLVPAAPGIVHEQQRNNEVLSRLKIAPDTESPEVWLSDDDRCWAETALQEHDAREGAYLVCLGIGAGERVRLWPAERFGEIASWLIEQMDARIVIVGDARDRALAEPLARGSGGRVVNLAGICSLRQSAAVLALCDLFVGNDSGPMHIASAAGVPVVEISCHPLTADAGHLNSPRRYAPVGVRSRIIQPRSGRYPCTDGCQASSAHCILDIGPSDVKAAITDLLAEAIPSPGRPKENSRSASSHPYR